MKLTIEPRLLADTVAWAARALPNRPVVPVLAGLLLEADGDQVTISAFDYDVSSRATIPADVAEPGRIVLPGRLLAELTKTLPDRAMLDLAATGAEATLTYTGGEFGILTLPADDYPALPEPPAPAGSIDAGELATAVNQVHVACSSDDTLPMLTAIRLDTDGDQLTVAATDRYRIAVRDTTWQPITDTPIGVCIPGRTLHDITRALGAGTVDLAFNDGMAAFTNGGRQTTVRLLDDQFIDYQARTVLDANTTATINPRHLADAVKRVALVGDRTTPIRLTFTPDEVLVQAASETGRGSQTADCTLDGDPIEIAFQASFLTDALTAVQGEQAAFGMTGPHRPALITGDGDAYRYLVMALRTTS
ncbi:DNA polymerase III subunit beta [Nonomuraea turcica]|uniref:DNA polymerase III subunit beta n=1 Tax=Nonomuraea sp. G32 TaxID=3067274 RepID=UPI00273B879D|nr:DNA polymerase III subunit beta [Nonomuraea sp. G32]MDP4501025.1 DNA polymerase III subunit beta [Nonomuraea sp. G32]